jgi:hypothetical protein
MPSHAVGSLWRFAEAVLRGRVDIERSLKIRSQEQRLRARTKTTLPTPGYYLKAQIRQGAGSAYRVEVHVLRHRVHIAGLHSAYQHQ